MTLTAAPAAEQVVLTPRAGRVVKRSLFWVGVAVLLLILGLVSIVSSGSTVEGPPLDPTNPAPAGAMAVAEVLKQQGVDVVATSTLDDTIDAIDDPANTTLFLYDGASLLNDAKLREALGLADTVVIADPDFGALRIAAPALAMAGLVNESLDADCDVAVVQRAGTVSGEGSGYRVVDETAELTPCLGSGDDVFSLVELDRDGTTLTVLGATGALSNEFVGNDGNAAFALGLLGENETLVWYLPSFDDVESANPDAIAEATPAWVVPVMSLLVITFIVGAIWRGRRLGPLVIENLPVTVRASETMLGRARLYERSSSRLRALDSLRIGSVQRLAGLCGLPRTATVDDVIAAVSSITGAQPAEIRALLVESVPANDRELLASSDALLTLERTVALAIRS